MQDSTGLPDKYMFNRESLSENKYIDDNSLFVYFCISRELFSNSDKTGVDFLFLHPFEWNSIDYCSFLLSASKEYNLAIGNIRTIFPAVREEYQVSHKPKQYKGAYRWILELKEKEPEREEVILFNKFLTDSASVSDIERALIYADRIVPIFEDEKSELSLSKDIFRRIVDYTSFSIDLDAVSKNKLTSDIDSYLEAFVQEKLVRNSESKKMGNAYVSQSQNILTFRKHSSLFRAYLQRMQDDFGNIITIENIFEDRFPNLEYPSAWFIRKRYAERNFLFLHILLAFKKQGFIKISLLGSNWDYHEDKMLTYRADIELLPPFFSNDPSRKLHFDKDKSRFYVQGKEIKLLKFKDEYHTLRIMFENPDALPQEWFFSEIAERIDEGNPNDKKYYNAIYQLKIKLAKQDINDFFITTKQSVKINEKYLS